ncbi:hypothetical protein SEA_TOMAS_149 [Streptomyces phage Tomas]|uniref:Uncharacterized protein n=1 Tax=Streptomyces phage Tomas TaxID=2914443 RepID=A0AA49BSC1_9CAUD|nr:hypothetical protein PP453_gp148 [Streptomyces phage Tomas]UMO76319.1 hypothetical protein SEA_TOMAS_149 [Streptomyces phage Tomas]
MNIDFTGFIGTNDVEYMLKCTFCPEEATTELTVEFEPGTVVPLPTCESCKVTEAK